MCNHIYPIHNVTPSPVVKFQQVFLITNQTFIIFAQQYTQRVTLADVEQLVAEY